MQKKKNEPSKCDNLKVNEKIPFKFGYVAGKEVGESFFILKARLYSIPPLIEYRPWTGLVFIVVIFNMRVPIILYHTRTGGHVSKIHLWIAAS